MSVLEPSNLSTWGHKKYNIAEAQDKGLKVPFMNVIKVLKEEKNNPLNQWKQKSAVEWNEFKVQDL